MPSYSNGPAKRRGITLHYDIRSCLSSAGVLSPVASPKKLKRLPHIFCKTLELPFASDTPVTVQETQDCYAFLVQQPGLVAEDVRIEVLEIVPGATKVVMRGAERIRAAVLEDVEMMNPWRFRLPACTIPEAATSDYQGGILTITIPKIRGSWCADDDPELVIAKAGSNCAANDAQIHATV